MDRRETLTISLIIIGGPLVVLRECSTAARGSAVLHLQGARPELLARAGEAPVGWRATLSDPPRATSTPRRCCSRRCETTATVPRTPLVSSRRLSTPTAGSSRSPRSARCWSSPSSGSASGPRTLGRQHAERVALGLAAPLVARSPPCPVRLPRLLILLGNALTPGRGFREGPFATEAELRELVDLAEQSALIESGERPMIHSVFELGDTIVREVMVPRTDMVVIERYKTLRQATSLALRIGFSRIPVIGEGLDDVMGVAYLKDIIPSDFDRHEAETTERIETVMRPASSSPTPSRPTSCCREMQESACTWRSSSTSTAAPPGW